MISNVVTIARRPCEARPAGSSGTCTWPIDRGHAKVRERTGGNHSHSQQANAVPVGEERWFASSADRPLSDPIQRAHRITLIDLASP